MPGARKNATDLAHTQNFAVMFYATLLHTCVIVVHISLDFPFFVDLALVAELLMCQPSSVAVCVIHLSYIYLTSSPDVGGSIEEI